MGVAVSNMYDLKYQTQISITISIQIWDLLDFDITLYCFKKP